MSEVWNVGKDVISAYLSGLQHKERREALVNQALYRQQQMQIAQEKIDEGRKKFELEHKLNTEKLASEDALRKATINNFGVKIRQGGLDILNRAKGNLLGQDGKPIDINTVLDPTANAIHYKSVEDQNKEEVDKQVRIAQGQEDVKQPGRVELVHTRGNIDAANDAANKAADAIQKEKDRQNRITVANIRASAVHNDKASTKADKDAVDKDAVDLNLPNIMTGQTTLEDLNTLPAQTRLKVQNAALSNGFRIMKKEEQEKFRATPTLERFIDKVKAYKDAVNGYDLVQARNLYTSLQADLGIFARNEKGERGNMSNQDITRMAKLLPGLTFTKEANEQRYKDLENIYHDRMDQTFRGMTPTNRAAVEQRWGIRSRPVKDEKGDEWVPKK